MKRKSGVLGVIVFSLLTGTSPTLSFAQQRQAAPDRATIERERVKAAADRDFVFETAVQGPELPPPGYPGDFVFLATEMNFGGKVIKGAPYSAQAVTESVQTLCDGNRIVNKSTAAIFRDSEGRTRREQTLRAVGAFANGGEPPQIIFITDPVAGTSYTLEPRTRTARQMPPMNFRFQVKAPAPGEEKTANVVMPPPADRVESGRFQVDRGQMGRAEMEIKASADQQFVWGWQRHAGVSESLGKQNVEGVEAEGTRSTTTIPAGEIGNERPIEIVNESWYSPELQTMVMTRHSDPRLGESTYRLTNIDRSEPAKSLFEVPADYTLKSAGADRVATSSSGGVAGGRVSVGEWSGGIRTMSRGELPGVVLNNKAISLPQPAYPQLARTANANGNVAVEVTVDEEGNVVAAKAVFGHPLLQAAAVEAARNAKFTPNKLLGQPVKLQGVLIYTFSSDSTQQK
jgi:TonB family protein